MKTIYHCSEGISHWLNFFFQTPVSPLLKPADPIFNQVLMKEDQDEIFDYPHEKEIPVLLVWTFGGKNVSVEGSWDHWKTRYLFLLPFVWGYCALIGVSWICKLFSCGVSQYDYLLCFRIFPLLNAALYFFYLIARLSRKS